jgi:hypothetical protein
MSVALHLLSTTLMAFISMSTENFKGFSLNRTRLAPLLKINPENLNHFLMTIKKNGGVSVIILRKKYVANLRD